MARTMIAMHQVRLADWVDRGMKDSPAQVMDAVRRQFVRTFCKPSAASEREGREENEKLTKHDKRASRH
jgi:hypothetical protein